MAYSPSNPFDDSGFAFQPIIPQHIPYFFDIEGKKQVSYAYVYGPHNGKICDCKECTKFNMDFQNREEQMALLQKVHDAANDTFRKYFMQSYRSPGEPLDTFTAMQIMVEFVKKQIAEYQMEMVKRVQYIQLQHTARLARVMAQQSKLAEVPYRREQERKMKKEHNGRLFMVDEKEDTK